MAESSGKGTTTYHVDRLQAEAFERFGVAPHVVAGALSGGRKQNYTLDEAQGLIDRWLKRRVEVDNPIGQQQVEEAE